MTPETITAIATLVTAVAVLVTAFGAFSTRRRVETVKETLASTNSDQSEKLDTIKTLVNGHTDALKNEIARLESALKASQAHEAAKSGEAAPPRSKPL